MKCEKNFFKVAVMAVVAIFSVFPCFAEESSETLYNRISENCGAIKQTLTTISYDDSRMRAELGAYYEDIAENYIIPLNTRFVKNNQPNMELSEIQRQFVEEREKFNESYIKYARGMEKLIAVDCKKEPEKFYQQLLELRELRAEVNAESRKMEMVIRKFYSIVEEIYEKQ